MGGRKSMARTIFSIDFAYRLIGIYDLFYRKIPLTFVIAER